MKERPILFSGPMVRAILGSQKTVTRRPVKGIALEWLRPEGFTPEYTADPRNGLCPYGQPGDRLWVREAWQADAQIDWVPPRELSPGEPIRYPADEAVRQTGCAMISPGKTRPSIHMPRWVSRILLEITAVRVERLQDISEEQARAEGITDGGCTNCGDHEPCGCECPAPNAVDSFIHLWNSINGADAWNANPWVWAVEFNVITPRAAGALEQA